MSPAAIAQLEITDKQQNLLRMIARMPGVSPSMLAHMLHVTPPTVLRRAYWLLQRQLIAEQKDNRFSHYRVTELGRRVLRISNRGAA